MTETSDWKPTASVVSKTAVGVVSVVSVVLAILAYIESQKANSIAEESNRISKEASKKAADLSGEANQINRKALDIVLEREKADRDFSAVISQTSIDSFNAPFARCKNINLALNNSSSRTASIWPRVDADNLLVKPTGKKDDFDEFVRLDSVAVSPREWYRDTFIVCAIQGSPANAALTVVLDGKTFRVFTYTYDKGKYRPDE